MNHGSSERVSYWPRRLLHISSLRSIKREADSRYNTYHQPRFATLSYTWGRFERPEGPALPVLACPWRIPAIDPAHFTVEQFRKTINNIGSTCAVDFLWLDVACLDFSNRANGLDHGVTMQQHIFTSSSQNFVWLCKTSGLGLVNILEDLEGVTQIPPTGPSRRSTISTFLESKAIPRLEEILQDPWFESLWTLQEAMVNPDAILLTASGDVIWFPWQSLEIFQDVQVTELLYDNGGSVSFSTPNVARITGSGDSRSLADAEHVSLRHLVRLCQIIRDLSHVLGHSAPYQSTLEKFQSLMTKSGLLAFGTLNILRLWEVAYRRNEARGEDQLGYLFRYVLGYQLPDSVSHYGTENFARQVVRQQPLLSHLFVRPRLPQGQNSWFYSPDCVIPDIDHLTQCFGEHVALMKFDSPSADFSGFVVPFLDISNSLSPVSSQNTQTHLLAIALDYSEIQDTQGSSICIPTTIAVPTRLPFDTASVEQWTVPTTQHHSCISFLETCIAQSPTKAMVIPAAYATGCPGSSTALAAGLLALEVSPGKWRRLGWMLWTFVTSDIFAVDHSVDLKGETLGLPTLEFGKLSGDVV